MRTPPKRTVEAVAEPDRKKYPTFTVFIANVGLVDEKLTPGERLVLFALAVTCDRETFESFPGNVRLKKLTGLSERGVDFVIKSLVAKKLITLIAKGGGSGHSNVYRVNVQDSRYPEPPSHQKAEPKPRSNHCPVSDEVNPAVEAAKPRSEATKTPQCELENPAVITAPHQKLYQKLYQKHQKHTHAQQNSLGECASDTFPLFWNAYPRKVSKAKAESAWSQVVGNGTGAAGIVAGVERWKQTRQWSYPEKIPYPAKFLTERRWEDEIRPEPEILFDDKTRERQIRTAAAIIGSRGYPDKVLAKQIRTAAAIAGRGRFNLPRTDVIDVIPKPKSDTEEEP